MEKTGPGSKNSSNANINSINLLLPSSVMLEIDGKKEEREGNKESKKNESSSDSSENDESEEFDVSIT